MRRFFTRFGTGGTGVGNGGKETNETNSSATQEKVGLTTVTSPTTPTKSSVSGDRVRALAQRYEGLNGSGGGKDDGFSPHSHYDGNGAAALSNDGNRTKAPPSWSSQTHRPNQLNGSKESNSSQSQRTMPNGGQRERSPLFQFDKPLPRILSQSEGRDDFASSLTRQHVGLSGHPQSSAVPQSAPRLPLMDDADGRIGFTAASDETDSQRYPLPGFPRQSISKDRDASGSSSGSAQMTAAANGAASTPAQGQGKSVAFAPSPKKPTRPNSPDIEAFSSGSATSATTDRMTEETLRQANSGAGPMSNFAKPTLASSARARGGGKQNFSLHQSSGSVPTNATSSTRHQGTEKFPSPPSNNVISRASLATPASSAFQAPPSMKRSSSAGARRGASAGATPSFQTGTEGISSSGQRMHGNGTFGAGGSTLHAQTARETSAPHPSLPNSIPFVNASTLGILRSASPQSMATVSSLHSGPVGTPDFFSNPRRASFQGRHHSGGSSQGAGNVALAASSSIRSIGAPSWSEMTQDDLVSNLGSRERTRQEVLWEIVASEERYVQELEKTKDFYLDALLHPNRFSPPSSHGTAHALSLAALEGRESGATKSTKDPRSSTAKHSNSTAVTGTTGNAAKNADLPIAARFMSATSIQQHFSSLDAAASSYATSQRASSGQIPYQQGIPQPTSSRPQSSGPAASTSNLQSTPAPLSVMKNAGETKESSKVAKRWSQRRLSNNDVASSQTGYDLTNGQAMTVSLPQPVREVLEAIDNGIYEGHALLSEALRVRYEEQWPLVRTLADVFTRFGYVLKYYRSYVLHLERALDCLEEAALMERAMRGKRLRKDRLSSTVALGRAVASLESSASERGECGLAIFLAMPFQRLLKYPLLFQNLLFHTDASTFEFENTVQMVVDVERIVRSIEDEKVNREERDKTIDAFARIEGIKDRALLRPKADRILIEERATYQENPRRAISESNNAKGSTADAVKTASGLENVGSTAMSTPLGVGSGNLRASIRNKRSYRRLSDLLTLSQPVTGSDDGTPNATTYTKAPNMGSKRDIWLVRFSDVELRCQRVGVTALPMISSAAIHPTTVPSTTNLPLSEQEEAAVSVEEDRMREEFRRTRESKERLRALRNTTLRSKTRNLYKFIGVSSWKATRGRPNLDDADGLDGLATAHEEDEEVEGMDEEGDESDDAESDASRETDGGLLDPEHYIRQSKLSFSYGGHDRVEPKMYAQGRTMSNVTSIRKGDGLSNQKRHSMGSASIPHATSSISASSTLATLPSITVQQASINSRHVAATSRLRSDKFGSRLRTIGDELPVRRGSMPNVVGATQAATAASDATSTGAEDEHEREQIEETFAEEMDRTAIAGEGDALHLEKDGLPSAFVREQSMDSDLYMMGTLVQQGTAR